MCSESLPPYYQLKMSMKAEESLKKDDEPKEELRLKYNEPNDHLGLFGRPHEKWMHIDSSRLDECLKYMYENNNKHIDINDLYYKENP